MQYDKTFTSHFVDSDTWIPIDNLTGVTIMILELNEEWTTAGVVVDNLPCINLTHGWYSYHFADMGNKWYLYYINPNDTRVEIESGFVDRRLNNLDRAVSKVRGWGGWGSILDWNSIEEWMRKLLKPYFTDVEKAIQSIEDYKKNTIDEINSWKTTFSEMYSTKEKEIDAALWLVSILSQKTDDAINRMNTNTVEIKQNSEKFVYSLEVKEEAKEQKELQQQIEKETAELNEKIQQKTDSEAKELTDKVESEIKAESDELNEKIKEEANRKANELEALQDEKQKELDEIRRKKDEIKNNIS